MRGRSREGRREDRNTRQCLPQLRATLRGPRRQLKGRLHLTAAVGNRLGLGGSNNLSAGSFLSLLGKDYSTLLDCGAPAVARAFAGQIRPDLGVRSAGAAALGDTVEAVPGSRPWGRLRSFVVVGTARVLPGTVSAGAEAGRLAVLGGSGDHGN